MELIYVLYDNGEKGRKRKEVKFCNEGWSEGIRMIVVSESGSRSVREG